MKTIVIYEDKYSKFVIDIEDDEELTDLDKLCILSENDFHTIDENNKLKPNEQQVYYLY